MTMPRLDEHNKATIPKSVRDWLGLGPGDRIKFQRKNGEVLLHKAEEDFPTTNEPIGPKARKAIEQSRAEFSAGKGLGPFATHEELMKALNGPLK